MRKGVVKNPYKTDLNTPNGKAGLCTKFNIAYIQGVSGGIVNILRGGSMDYSE